MPAHMPQTTSPKLVSSHATPSSQEDAFTRFLVLWSGQLVSSIGNGLTAFVLGVYAFQTTNTASSYTMTLLCAFLPSVCLSPVGGVLADRYDRRTLIIISDIGAISGLLYILLSMSLGQVTLWQIYLGVAWSSIFTAVRSPAYKATVTDMLPPEKYEQASGLVQLAGSAQYLISPLVAGMFMGIMPIQTILVLDIFSFVLAIITVFAVRKHIKPLITSVQTSGRNFIQEMKEGLLTITSHKGILALVGLTTLVLFFVGLLQALLGPMLLAFTDVETFGTAQSICALGLLVGSLLIGIFGIRQNLVTVLSFSLGGMGLFYAAMSLSTNMVWVVVPGVLFFLTIPFINTSIEVLIRDAIASEKQGRAWSFISVMTFAGSITAFGSGGLLADHLFNPLFEQQGTMSNTFLATWVGTGAGRGIAFMFLISGLCLLCLALITFKSKAIRSVEVRRGGINNL